MSATHSALLKPAQLDQLQKNQCATITGLDAGTSAEQAAVKIRLLELGFAPGVKVRVIAEAFPGRDPIAVRVGNTTFALRRHEAAMIHIVSADLAAVATID